jgi:hypothetical protein
MVVRCPQLCRPEGSSPAAPAESKRGPAASAPDHEAAQLFERVIAAVTRFCPGVEAVEPGVCAFSTRGPARYFGGETRLAGRVIAAIADLGAEPRVGAADGLFAALLAAQAATPAGTGPPSSAGHSSAGPSSTGAPGAGPSSVGQAGVGPILLVPPGRTAEFLARQPVSVLEDHDLAGLLSRLGLRTLGDLAALPVSDVASRFGAVGETAHRLARGQSSRPLAVRPPAEDLSVAQEFDPPHALAEPVVFAAKALAERMHDGLAVRGLACVRVQVQATWADGRESRRLWRHDGLLSAAGLADRVRWQLAGWRVPLGGTDAGGTDAGGTDAGGTDADGTDADGTDADGTGAGGPDAGDADTADGGIAVLRLVPDQIIQATGYQLALWGETAVSGHVARAAMRVQALLGHEAVLRPVLGGGRDVSERVTPVPFGEKREPRRAAGQPWPGRVMGPAPGVVYPFAREAEVTDDAGNAVTVTGRCVVSAAPAWLAAEGEPPLRVTGWAGPWPLSERWWDPAAARRRARFQLLTGDGRAWLAAVQDGRWLIEGAYR